MTMRGLILTAIATLLLAACGKKEEGGGGYTAGTCSVGAIGCQCTAGGGCDPGLTCQAGRCLTPNAGGDDAGDATTPGDGSGGDGPYASCSGTPGCQAGEVCVSDVCRKLCNRDADCDSGQICNAGLCELGTRSPIIESIDGDGTPNMLGGAAPHHLASAFVIRGQSFAGATVTLDDGSTATSLALLSSTDTEIVATPPPTVTPGSYVLTVTGAAGSDQATVTLLQGEPGVAGQDGADGFTSLIEMDNQVGGNCSNGGTRILTGVDDDRNGVLDTAEVDRTAYVCSA